MESITTIEVSKYLKINHTSIIKLIKTNLEFFSKLGEVKEIQKIYGKKTKGGRPGKSYILNEKQYFFLITLLKNNERGIKEKYILTKSHINSYQAIKKETNTKYKNENINYRNQKA